MLSELIISLLYLHLLIPGGILFPDHVMVLDTCPRQPTTPDRLSL